MKCALIACLAAFIPAHLRADARADDGWTLITSDFNRQPVALISLDEHGLRITRPGQPNADTLPLDQFLQLTRAADRPSLRAPQRSDGRPMLYLSGGDRITGELAGIQGEHLSWKSPTLGDLSLSLRQVRAISKAPPRGLDDDRKEDQVQLANGDSVRGIVAGFEGGNLSIQTGNDTAPVPFASVDTVYFASTAKAAPNAASSEARAFRVRLADDSLMTVPTVTVDAAQLHVRLPGSGANDAPRPLPLAAVAGIEQLNGPVSWLSTRKPESEQQVSFSSDMHFPARMDATVTGGEIRFGTRTYAHGIGVHANSTLVFALDPAWKAFRTQYALDTEHTYLANVTVRILLDGAVVHEQTSFGSGKLSPVIAIDLKGAKTLTLEVTAGGITDSQDRFNWIEPALLRDLPAPQTQPATEPAKAPAGPAATP